MDLLKTPSVQSLLDSDLESVGSLQYLDIEELDEIEYALPASEAPTLEEVLSTEDEENISEAEKKTKSSDEPVTCSALQVDFLQAVSQQVLQAQERSSAGAATALGVANDGRITVGTAHGQLLSFCEQTLRWVCTSNMDGCGAVSCLSYNTDSTRILAGYARGLICQYESVQGTILRRITLGGETWGILQVTWAGTSGLGLDTGGSVWLMKFSRPLGVRSARTSCLFSGARGEVVAMTARDAHLLALATLSRVIIVVGGRAAGLRLSGPPDTLPVLEWSETDDRILVCARANTLQWLSLHITGTAISLRPIKQVQLNNTPLWLGWLGGNVAIFDSDENLRLLGDDYDKPLDLSHIEPVYASAIYKGHWTDGRVSRAMCAAGASALAGACVSAGALSVLGRRGVVRVRPRDALARAQALLASGRHAQALRLLCSSRGADAKAMAVQFVTDICERPHIVHDKTVADLVLKLCILHQLGDELWTNLWEQCSSIRAFVEAIGDAAVRGELSNAVPPSPDSTQALVERLAELEPSLVERVVASLPLQCLDPHRASVFTRARGLWRAVGAIAAALGGWSDAMVTLAGHVSPECSVRRGACTCAGSALVLAAADALGGRASGGRALPYHRRPSARHDALQALLNEEASCGGRSPLRVMCEHEAASAVRLLEQCVRDPPFAGPLAKQNRLRVAAHLLAFAKDLPDAEDRIEVLEFLTGQMNSGMLPPDRDAMENLVALASATEGERADRAWLALVTRARPERERLEAQRVAAAARPRVLWRLHAALDDHQAALQLFFDIDHPSDADVDELFEYVRTRAAAGEGARDEVLAALPALVELRPRAAAALIGDRLDAAAAVLAAATAECALEFGESLREVGLLSGDAAAAHLRLLCRLRPTAVRTFLTEEAGAVRPEEALAIVRDAGLPDAEPACLEAAGDAPAALDGLLRLAAAADDADDGARWTREAGELCARVAPTMPPAAAASMWSRLLRAARDAPPALLLAAFTYLPPEETREHACRSREVALATLACAMNGLSEWECCARVASREAHEELARALKLARRGVAVRGRCARCGRRLAERAAVRTAHCARACHADCEPEPCCTACGRRTPDSVVVLPARAAHPPAPPVDFALLLAAPPRPDLEGVV